MNTQLVATFAVTAAGIVLVPGPSVMFIVSRALVGGRPAAFAAAAGNTFGQQVHMRTEDCLRSSQREEVTRSGNERDDAVGHELHAWIRAVALDPAVVQLLHDDAGLPQRERLVPLDVGE